MRTEQRFSLRRGILMAAMLGPGLVACSQSGPSDGNGTSGTGASPGAGATGGSAGTTTMTGTGGTMSVGGATGTGGATGSGGSSGSGATSGTGAVGGGMGGSGVGGAAAGTSAGGMSAGGMSGGGGTTPAGGMSGGGGMSGSGGAGAGGMAAGGAGGMPDACPTPPAEPTGSSDAVAGNLITFNDNGGWCWYQDERAVVDTKANKLVIGSVAFGGNRNGNIEAVIYDIGSGKVGSPAKLGNISVDDHNAPGIVITPGGQYVAMYAGHRVDCNSRYSVYNGTSWSAEKSFNWAPDGCPWAGASTNMITYANPWYMDGAIYSLVRSVGTDPAVLTSTDNGQNWSYYGRLMSTQQKGYVAGYFKYWGDNTSRIDFVGTEAHPRDFDTSLYHGYIEGGKVYNSSGKVMDDSLKDSSATSTTSVDINTYTPVFKTGTMLHGVSLCRMWNHDIVRYADGSIAILGQGRTNDCSSTPSGSDPDKRIFYSRWDGQTWKTTYLVKAGPKLYDSEEDYTGLSALDPDNPHIIYVSSTYDPRDDTTKTPKHELYEGITCDDGATWTWTPITKGSTQDNLRPIVPKWDGTHKALLWMRGTYSSAQSMTMKIVGLVTGP